MKAVQFSQGSALPPSSETEDKEMEAEVTKSVLEAKADTEKVKDPELLEEKPQLRPLTSLNWPYVPEESAFSDPLKRDDPKPLQLNQYEAIGAFSTIFSQPLPPEYHLWLWLRTKVTDARSFPWYAHGMHLATLLHHGTWYDVAMRCAGGWREQRRLPR